MSEEKTSNAVPGVLVVVPTLGQRKEWLVAALQSVSTQAQPSLFSLRVVLVAPETAQLAGLSRENEVELLVSNRPGLSAAINDGWAIAHEATYVCWLGDDDLLAPGSLESTVRALNGHPHAAAAYGQVRYIQSDGATMWLQKPTRFAGRYMKFGKNFLPQQGSLIRWSVAQEIGGLDERFRSAMDQDLFTRLLERGKLLYVPREIAAFRIHDSNITVTKGRAGNDEGDEIRERSTQGRFVPPKMLMDLIDRAIYSIMRRIPASPPPKINGFPYTG